MRTRRTKIVATLGPKTNDPASLRALFEAGTDVVRLNYAHGDAEFHETAAEMIRAQAREAERPVAILVDLPGPKLRTGAIGSEGLDLEAGSHCVLTSSPDAAAQRVPTNVPEFGSMVAPGNEILLADGEIALRVRSVEGDDVHTEVVNGGVLTSGKAIHVPFSEERVSVFTQRDWEGLETALRVQAQYVGLSFVGSSDHIRRMRQALDERDHSPRLVAKIETASAVNNLDDIIPEADAVMVARGDLGMQTPMRRVPLLQKEIVGACNRRGVPVITATQMLGSMVCSPVPSRAEVGDVVNAVLDGSDALMLADETAVGDFAPRVVRVMTDSIESAEAFPVERLVPPCDGGQDEDHISWSMAHAAVQAAEHLNAAAIVCPGRTGDRARKIAAFRPSMPILAFTPHHNVQNALSLTWGVTPVLVEAPENESPAEKNRRAVAAGIAAGLIKPAELLIVAAGDVGLARDGIEAVEVVRAQTLAAV